MRKLESPIYITFFLGFILAAVGGILAITDMLRGQPGRPWVLWLLCSGIAIYAMPLVVAVIYLMVEKVLEKIRRDRK